MMQHTDAPELNPEYVRSVWELMAPHLNPALFVHRPALDDAVGTRVTLAGETLQHTGSFKTRAAYNLVRSIPNTEIVSASSGNFGAALARVCRMLERSCTVVMPTTSSKVKIASVERQGATVDLVDTAVKSRAARVQELLAARPDAFYAPAYDDPRVVAGNSTLGREIFARSADWDAILVPVGGGGLISGIVTARDTLGLKTPIYGAEPALGNDAARSLRAGELIANEAEPATIADGARTISLGQITWPIVQRGVEDIVEVPDAAIAEGVRTLFRHANLKAEPTGALSIAAAMLQRERFAGKRICCIVSGGNVDEEIYAAILRREI
ncbi:MAG: threo-3-hydroxy-L-aspartate ammonia-lyase [Chloroflexota bacterium]|nr:threo-3-hydroxy-L-aspartate ammonia-lyase [Chloroflexota bacterium]